MLPRSCCSRDFHRSGSLLRQQFHSTVRSSRTHFWNERLGCVTSLSRRAPRLACSSAAPFGPLLPLLTFATCYGMALPALPSLLMRRVPNGAPIFPPQLGTLCFLTTSSTHSLFASRLSRPCTNLADLLLPSLTTSSLLRSRSVTSLRQVRTALPYSLFQVSFPFWRHLLLSFFNLVLRLAVVPSAWKSSLVVPVIKRDGDPHYS